MVYNIIIEKILKEDLKLKGIYKITNTENGKMYIGRSENIEARFITHITQLKDGTHSNWKLQNAYNLLKDKSRLRFEILEEIKDSNLLPIAEQYYYDKYNVYENGYNLSRFADKPSYDYETYAKTRKVFDEVNNTLPPTLSKTYAKTRKTEYSFSLWLTLGIICAFIIIVMIAASTK